jgi:NNP family nitrate/nitrite transporter-like MFS transporter
VTVAAALAWMHYAIRSAERAEWTARESKTDLPELASPYLFYPLNRPSEGLVDSQVENRGNLHQRQN